MRYYVALNGDDSGPGSFQFPWLTPGKVTSEAAASTFAAGDTISFRGGDLFIGSVVGDCSISLNNAVGTAAAPITVNSYGTGKATLESTNVGITPVNIDSSSSYVVVDALDLTLPDTISVDGAGRCFNSNAAANITVKNCEAYGGSYGFAMFGADNHIQDCISRWAWNYGAMFSAAGGTFDGLEVIGAGYSLNHATKNATAGEGIGLWTVTAGSVVGSNLNTFGCVRSVHVEASTDLTVNRYYNKVDRTDQDTAILAEGTDLTIINGVLLYDARVSGGGTYYMIDSAAGNTDLVNCTVSSLISVTEDIGSVMWRIQGAATTEGRNSNFSSLYTDLIRLETGGTYTGERNNIISALATPCHDFDNGGDITALAWIGFNETSTLNTDPMFINTDNVQLPGPAGLTVTRTLSDARLVEIDETSSLFLLGTQAPKATHFDPDNFPYTDHFGNPRPPVIAEWTIGAFEPVVDTYQDFGVFGGDPEWNITSPGELPSYTALLQVPDTNQGYSFFVESELYTENLFTNVGETARVGIWALGSRLTQGSAGQAPAPIATKAVWDAPTLTGVDPFSERTDIWQLGPTVLTDLRRIISYVDHETRAYRMYSEHPDILLDTTVSLTPAQLAADALIMRLEFIYHGRLPGGVNGVYVYDIIGLLNGETVLAKHRVKVPASWIEGIGYDLGRAHYAGLYGVDAQDTLNFGWNGLSGSITSALSSVVPRGNFGNAREKDYLAARNQAPNLLVNGGFSSYPRQKAVVRRPEVVSILDPDFVAASINDTVGVHVGFILDASNSVTPFYGHIVNILNSCVAALPTDGSVMLTVIRHWAVANTVIPPTVITPQNQAALLATILGLGTTQSGEVWPAAWNLMTSHMNTGAVINGKAETGFNKIIFNVTDHAIVGGSFPQATVSAALSPMHALPGLKEVSLLLVEAQVQQVYNAGRWPQAYFPQNIPVNTPTVVGQPHESTVIVPNTTGAIALSINGDSGSTIKPSTNQGLTGAVAATQLGLDAFTQVTKWRDDWVAQIAAVAANPIPPLFADAFQAISDRNPGVSLNVPSTRPTEGTIAGWAAWGSASILEVLPPETLASPDGGNVVKLALGATGAVTLAQPLTDLRPLAGQEVSFAFSASAGAGRIKVELVVVVNGEDRVLGTFYSRSFGLSSRVTRSTLMPVSLQSAEVQLRFSGPVDTSMHFSGVQASLGSYTPQLPYSQSPVDSIIPRGTVLMVTGDSCPPGYQQVPESAGRVPYGFLGDPNFYERGISPSFAPTAPPTVFDSVLDLGIMVDGSSDQASHAFTIQRWLLHLIMDLLPEDDSVRVTIIFTNKAFNSFELMPLTPVNAATKAGLFLTQINKLVNNSVSPTFGGNDRIFQGIDKLKANLAAANGEQRMLIWNDSHTYGFTSQVTNSLNALFAIPRFVESSSVSVGSTSGQVRAVHGETHAFPQPSTVAPGITFTWTGGAPGSAPSGAFSSSSFQAGEYMAETFYDRIKTYLPVVSTATVFRSIDGLEPNNLGGQTDHDHSGGTEGGSSIDEADGFESPIGEDTQTDVSLLTRDTAQIKVYPFAIQPNVTRPEDPPVLAIGPQHRHTVNTEMSAQPPGFNIRMCEKL